MEEKKFVINDGDLILGEVEFHEELIRGRNRSKTVGGGRWYVDEDTDTIYFFGESTDFGAVTNEQFDAAFKQPGLSKFNIVFSNELLFKDVLKEIEESCNNL